MKYYFLNKLKRILQTYWVSISRGKSRRLVKIFNWACKQFAIFLHIKIECKCTFVWQ